jgi:hypothetical protein
MFLILQYYIFFVNKVGQPERNQGLQQCIFLVEKIVSIYSHFRVPKHIRLPVTQEKTNKLTPFFTNIFSSNTFFIFLFFSLIPLFIYNIIHLELSPV